MTNSGDEELRQSSVLPTLRRSCDKRQKEEGREGYEGGREGHEGPICMV